MQGKTDELEDVEEDRQKRSTHQEEPDATAEDSCNISHQHPGTRGQMGEGGPENCEAEVGRADTPRRAGMQANVLLTHSAIAWIFRFVSASLAPPTMPSSTCQYRQTLPSARRRSRGGVVSSLSWAVGMSSELRSFAGSAAAL